MFRPDERGAVMLDCTSEAPVQLTWHLRQAVPVLITRGFRTLPTPGALLGRGVGTNGAVVPRNSSVGGEGYGAFTDGAPAPLVLRALSHLASPCGSLHLFTLIRRSMLPIIVDRGSEVG